MKYLQFMLVIFQVTSAPNWVKQAGIRLRQQIWVGCTRRDKKFNVTKLIRRKKIILIC